MVIPEYIRESRNPISYCIENLKSYQPHGEISRINSQRHYITLPSLNYIQFGKGQKVSDARGAGRAGRGGRIGKCESKVPYGQKHGVMSVKLPIGSVSCGTDYHVPHQGCKIFGGRGCPGDQILYVSA